MDNQTAIAIAQHVIHMGRSNGYLARQEIEHIVDKLKTDPKRLEPYGFKVYSQNGEDGILEEIFRRLEIKDGLFCEVGVESGLESNSLFLLHKGWKGTWIEANREQEEKILQKFHLLIPERLNLVIELLTVANFNQLLGKLAFSGDDLDFLSLDIDGNDVYLLECMILRPKVICIEYNSKFPGNLAKSQTYDPSRSWQGTDYMGASLKFVTKVAKRKGYQLVATDLTGTNAFYVRDDLVGEKFCQNSSSEHLYNPPRYWLHRDHYRDIGHPADFGSYTDLI